MKNRSLLLAIVSTASVAFAGHASAISTPHYDVTQSQLDALHQGESRSEVIHALGSPMRVSKWPDGTTSLVYEIQTTVSGPQSVYVDLNNAGKMMSFSIDDE
ncbi:MAG: hypothetical protein QM776_14085 [Rhodocyclaceae bacterium]